MDQRMEELSSRLDKIGDPALTPEIREKIVAGMKKKLHEQMRDAHTEAGLEPDENHAKWQDQVAAKLKNVYGESTMRKSRRAVTRDISVVMDSSREQLKQAEERKTHAEKVAEEIERIRLKGSRG